MDKDLEQRMREIAEEVYADKGTQYGVADAPVHIHDSVDLPAIPASSVDAFLPLPSKHNGVASPGVLGSQVINDPNQASNINLAGAFNSATIYVNPIPIVYGLGNGLVSVTGAPALNATSATLTTAWPYASGTTTTTFDSGDTRAVVYTKGSTSITWTPGLSAGCATTALGLSGSPYAFAGGDAPAGTMVFFTNSTGAEQELWVRVNTIPGFNTGTLTLTGSLSSGATAGTLTAAWTHISATAWILFSSGETRAASFTSGSTAVTFSALTASATATITVSAIGWRGIEFNLLLPSF